MPKGRDEVFEDIPNDRVPIHGYLDPVSGKIVLACPDAETDMIQEERVSDKIFESLTLKAKADSTYERMEESVSPEVAFDSFMKFIDDKDKTDMIPKYFCNYPAPMLTLVPNIPVLAEPKHSYNDPAHMLSWAINKLKLTGQSEEKYDPIFSEHVKDEDGTDIMSGQVK